MNSRLVVMMEAGGAAAAGDAAAASSGLLGSSLPRDGYMMPSAGPGAMRNVGSSPAMLQQHMQQQQQHGSALSLDAYGQYGQYAPQQQQQQQQYSSHPSQQYLVGGAHGSSGQLLAADVLAGMSRSLSEMSLDAAGQLGGQLGGRYGNGSMSTGDLLGLAGGGGRHALRGIARTGSLWTQQQHPSLGSSPVGGGAWPQGMAMPGDAYALQQQQHQAAAAALQQQAAALNAAALLGGAGGLLPPGAGPCQPSAAHCRLTSAALRRPRRWW